MRSCPMPQPMPLVLRSLQALRAAGVSVQMHAGSAEGMGSMKSQFKKADASGARYALIFGADELAQGAVTVKSLRDGTGAQVQRPLDEPAAWAATPQGLPGVLTTIAGSDRTTSTWQNISTSKNRNSLPRSSTSGTSTAISSPGSLIAVFGVDRRLERLAVLAAHAGGAGRRRCTTKSSARRRPATPPGSSGRSPT